MSKPNDETLYNMMEYEKTKQKEEKEHTEGLEWEPLIPFEKKSLPVFPVDIYPRWLQDYVESVAESTQTPIDAAGMGAIPILSTALAKKFYISPRNGWSESLNIYCVQALPPGNRKSAVCKDLQKPITAFEKEERERVEPLISKQRAALKAKKKRIEHLEKEYSKKGDAAILEEIVTLNAEIDKEELLTIPRFIAGDVTAEKLGVLMAENNERMAILSAEGGGVFSNMAGRYSNDGRANIEIYLNGHTGDYTAIDRIGREPVLLNEPCLTISLFVQPEVVRDVPPTFNERGLMPRFLFSFPSSIVGYRKVNPEVISEEIKERYLLNIKKILKLDTNEPIKLTFDEEAARAQIEMSEALERMFIDGGRLADMKEWGSKLAGQIIRIAGLLHVSEQADCLSIDNLDINTIPKKIKEATFSKAWQLLDYFIEHAKEAYGIMGSVEQADDAKYLLKYLLKKGKTEYVRREVQQDTKGKLKTADRFEKAVRELEERSYVQKRESNAKGRGRRSYHLILNPQATIPTILGNGESLNTPGIKKKDRTLLANGSQSSQLNNRDESFNNENNEIDQERPYSQFKAKDTKNLAISENNEIGYDGNDNKDDYESELI